MGIPEPALNDVDRITAIDALKQAFGERISTSSAVCEQHSRGESWHRSRAVDAVFFPTTTEEVASAVVICAAHRLPVIPFGAGTSIEGHVTAPYGGLSIDLSQMNQILRVSTEDLDCTVQAGVLRKQLNTFLRDTGLFFPVDPGADATIGGMASTRASGTNAVRYGTLRENVLGLTVVTPQGKVIKTGSRAKKSSAGYDLSHLYVGAEGTLGIITEVTLKLYGLPEAISSAVVNFPSIDQAVNACISTIQLGMPIARIELLDEATVKAVNAYCKTDYPERPTLFLEFHGTEKGVEEQIDLFAELAAEQAGGDLQWATREEDRNRLWNARHNAYYALLAMHPGKEGFTTDVCVPISRLAECIAETKQDAESAGYEAPILGHVGDGNFHMLFCVAPGDEVAMASIRDLNGRLIERALAMDGTCTGEHGIGTGKLDYLRKEHGDAAVEVMQAVKRALDPDNIMNPGKTVTC